MLARARGWDGTCLRPDHRAQRESCLFTRHTGGRVAMRICVHCYPGPRGEDIPSAFYLGGRRLPVAAVLERWTDATHRYYEVMVDDGRRFVLRFVPGPRSW